MSTQQLLDHDLNPNGHRILLARGADVTILNNAITLGNGNLFRVIPGAGTGDDELMYIQTAGWTAGSVVYLEVTRDEDAISLLAGTSIPAGAASLRVSGDSSNLTTGQIATLSYDGANWILATAVGGSGTFSGTATALQTATTVVAISSATAPTNGQVLTATSSTAASWQTPSSSGGGQAIGRGANLTIDAFNTITLPAAGTANLFRVSPGAGTGEDELGAIITPSGWAAGSTIYLQAPTDGGNAITLVNLESAPGGGGTMILGGTNSYHGALTTDQLMALVYDGTQWIAPNTQDPVI